MKSTYAAAMKQIRAFEGGFVNHPRDPGGATNFGVTQAVYDDYRASKKLAKRSVKSITEAEVDEIYLTRYANKVRYDDLPAGVDFATGRIGPSGALPHSPQPCATRARRCLRRRRGRSNCMNALYGALVTVLAIVVRHGLTFIGGGIVFESMSDTAVTDFATQIAGVLITAAGLGWSIYQKHKTDTLKRTLKTREPSSC